MPGIYRPSFLVPSAHARPLPNSEDSSDIEGFNSDDKTDNAEAGEAAGDDEGGECSPSPGGGARADHPKGTRSVVQKRSSSARPAIDRYVSSLYCN